MPKALPLISHHKRRVIQPSTRVDDVFPELCGEVHNFELMFGTVAASCLAERQVGRFVGFGTSIVNTA